MDPERESPYWDRIVGDDWPEISPAAWNGLAAGTRDAADALNLGDATRAAHAFDDTVRSSESLRLVTAAMFALRHRPRDFADALYAAAETFGDFAELAHRTRNRILDTVAAATARIAEATLGDDNGDGVTDDEAEARTDAATTDSILAHARAEVVDIVAAALAAVGPRGLPALDDIAEALGQPGPWTVGAPFPVTPKPGPEEYAGPGPGQDAGANPTVGPIPGVLPRDRLEGPVVPPVGNDAPGPESQAAPDPHQAASEGPVPSGAGTGGPGPGPQPVSLQIDSSAYAESAAAAPARAAGNTTESAGETADPRSSEGDEDGQERKTIPGSTEESGNSGTVLDAPAGAVSGIGGAVAPVATPVLPPPPIGSTAHANPPPAPAAGPRARPVVAPPTDLPRVQPAAPVNAPGPAGPSPQSGATATPAGRPAPGSRDGAPARATGSSPESAGDADELVKSAVAAAAAAASAFVVGEEFDGDSALARTLLAGIRAVADTESAGVDFAVSVMRHGNGVSAFVSSNEGRGWLPAGLFLPRAVSTPWQWSVSEHAGWEGVRDPVRVLAEFALAWGAKSGAVLSAVASSSPADPGLRAQLREVPIWGSVPAATDLDLSSPSAGLLDRLGITGSARMLERVAAVPEGSLAVRCLELAVDAQMRVERTRSAAVTWMDASDLRVRILRAIRRQREFPDSWWEELRDVDDLLAASVLAQRIDTGRVKLGELRPDHAGDPAESATAAIRELTFQRRCNELVLLLSQPVTRQTLRDAVYAHAQILSHPMFGGRTPGSAGRAAVSTYGPR